MPRLIPAAAVLALAAVPFAPAFAAPAPVAGKQTVMPENPQARAFQEQFGYSEAVIHGDTVYLSGVVAGAPPAGMNPADYYAQTFERIGAILARAGSSWDDVLDITTYHVDIDASLTPLAAAKNRYVKAPFPTWTAIDIDRLYEPTATVEIKIVARLTPKRKGGR